MALSLLIAERNTVHTARLKVTESACYANPVRVGFYSARFIMRVYVRLRIDSTTLAGEFLHASNAAAVG